MPSVCFYFQVHQPFRLKETPPSWDSPEYFDDAKNEAILRKVTMKCYLPANKTFLEMIERSEGQVKISFSLSGVAMEQMERWAPDALDSFQKLARTGCVEFLAETYYHSLAALYDPEEFKNQVALQMKKVKKLFGQTPTAFRNTELIYSDRIGKLASEMGFQVVIAEGADKVLGWRSPNFVYQTKGSPARLLLKNYKLSDDVAFRFSNRSWDSYPLTTEKYASWLHTAGWDAHTINLFMDYETFGEHQWESTGIFEFLRHLPSQVLAREGWDFATPSEVARRHEAVAEMSFPEWVSWADVDRDLTAWKGNSMQDKALETAFELAPAIRKSGNEEDLHLWRKLLTSDHFYYMCTKWFADGDVHAYFSPYQNPYEAFLHYMFALDHFKKKFHANSVLEGEGVLYG